MVTPMLAEMSGSIHVGLCGLGSAIGVGLVGMKASEAVGRNPGAFGKLITLAVLGMALAEAIVTGTGSGTRTLSPLGAGPNRLRAPLLSEIL